MKSFWKVMLAVLLLVICTCLVFCACAMEASAGYDTQEDFSKVVRNENGPINLGGYFQDGGNAALNAFDFYLGGELVGSGSDEHTVVSVPYARSSSSSER